MSGAVEIARPSFLPAERPWPPRRADAPQVGTEGVIEVSGHLARDAELRFAVSGKGVLSFEIETGRGFPYEVCRGVASNPDEQRAAEVLQHQLRRGIGVRVQARGCHPRIDHGVAVLQLLDVTRITTPPEA